MKTNLLLFASLFCIQLQAQQDAQFTQYMYNTIIVNPAYAGTREALSIFVSHRSQWSGIDGAPKTSSLSFNTPIVENLGVGLSVLNDKIGPVDENNIALDFSYSIPTSEVYKLSFGIKGSMNLLNVDFTKLYLGSNNDVAFQNNIDNKLSPNVGVGFYLHSDISYVGISAPNLLEKVEMVPEKTHYYLIAGHVFDLSPSLNFKPAMQAKYVKGAPMEIDLSANMMINEKFVAGVSYRWNTAVSALLGFQTSESFFIGYSYDIDTTKLGNYNSGSHEIFLRFETFKMIHKTISPTFF